MESESASSTATEEETASMMQTLSVDSQRLQQSIQAADKRLQELSLVEAAAEAELLEAAAGWRLEPRQARRDWLQAEEELALEMAAVATYAAARSEKEEAKAAALEWDAYLRKVKKARQDADQDLQENSRAVAECDFAELETEFTPPAMPVIPPEKEGEWAGVEKTGIKAGGKLGTLLRRLALAPSARVCKEEDLMTALFAVRQRNGGTFCRLTAEQIVGMAADHLQEKEGERRQERVLSGAGPAASGYYSNPI